MDCVEIIFLMYFSLRVKLYQYRCLIVLTKFILLFHYVDELKTLNMNIKTIIL